jgi:hypothetical protein
MGLTGSLYRRHVSRWPLMKTNASQGAGRTIFGSGILPRIECHADAKPRAGRPAKNLVSYGNPVF